MVVKNNGFDLLFAKNVPHILENIFFSLDYVSFKTCYKVSKVWDEFLSSQSCQKLLEKMLMKKNKNEKKLRAALFTRNFQKSSKLVKLISNAGWIDFNSLKLWNQGTPLMDAIFRGHKDVVKVLLDGGAKPDLLDPCWTGGWTPLYLAAWTGNKEIVQLLLERRANPNTAIISGHTPLNAIVECNLAIAESERKDIVKMLINGGAHLNKQNDRGWTPLHMAVRRGQRAMVEVLLEMGADPNIVSQRNGLTSLFLAEYWGHIKIAQLLRQHTNPSYNSSPVKVKA